MFAIGSIFDLTDKTMWLSEPHVPIELTRVQAEEYARLINDRDYLGNSAIEFVEANSSIKAQPVEPKSAKVQKSSKEPWWKLR